MDFNPVTSIITLNVNGLHTTVKRQRLSGWIQKEDGAAVRALGEINFKYKTYMHWKWKDGECYTMQTQANTEIRKKYLNFIQNRVWNKEYYQRLIGILHNNKCINFPRRGIAHKYASSSTTASKYLEQKNWLIRKKTEKCVITARNFSTSLSVTSWQKSVTIQTT